MLRKFKCTTKHFKCSVFFRIIIIGFLVACNPDKKSEIIIECISDNSSKICHNKLMPSFTMIFDRRGDLIECNLTDKKSNDKICWSLTPDTGKIRSIRVSTESGMVYDFYYSPKGELEQERCLDLNNQMRFDMLYSKNKKELSCSYLIPNLKDFLKTFYVDLSLNNDTLDNYFMYYYSSDEYTLRYKFESDKQLHKKGTSIEYVETPDAHFNFSQGQDQRYYPFLKTKYSARDMIVKNESNLPIIGYVNFGSRIEVVPNNIGHIIFNGDLIEKWRFFNHETEKYKTLNLKKKLVKLVLKNGFESKQGRLVPGQAINSCIKN